MLGKYSENQKKSPLEIKNMATKMKNPLEVLADKVEKTSQEVEQKHKEMEKLRGPTPNSRHSVKRT